MILLKKILGVVGSYRKQGNTELFVKLAMMEAEKHDLKVEMIRLTDFNFKPCRGCMACVFKAAKCRINDDFYEFLNHIEHADGVLFGSPTYILGPQAQFKQILDRFLLIPQHIDNLQHKPACTVTVSGLKGWHPLSPVLNLVVLSLGMNLLDSIHIYGPGPGQALLNEESYQKAIDVGKNLALAIKGEDYDSFEIKKAPNSCPVCDGELFTPIRRDKLQCALCHTRASIVESNNQQLGFTLKFEAESLKHHRWTEEAMVHHIEEWVKATEHMYLGKLEEINKLKAQLKSFDRWIPRSTRKKSFS